MPHYVGHFVSVLPCCTTFARMRILGNPEGFPLAFGKGLNKQSSIVCLDSFIHRKPFGFPQSIQDRNKSNSVWFVSFFPDSILQNAPLCGAFCVYFTVLYDIGPREWEYSETLRVSSIKRERKDQTKQTYSLFCLFSSVPQYNILYYIVQDASHPSPHWERIKTNIVCFDSLFICFFSSVLQ